MKRIKALAMMAAMMAASANDEYGNMLCEDKPRLRCGDCEHCPTGNKTFCKAANHQTTKMSYCTNCRYYKKK